MKAIYLILLMFFFGAAYAAPVPLDGIVAVVNDTPILQSQLARELGNLKTRLESANLASQPDAVLAPKVLEALITQEVQRQAAKARGITVDDALIDEQIQAVAARNQLSVPQLQARLAQEGVHFADYRRILGHEVLLSKLLAATVYRNVFVSEQEVDDFLAQNPSADQDKSYHLLHILITTPENPSVKELKAANDKAAMLMQKLEKGADFAQLAIEYSQGQQALQGGDLGYLRLAEVPSAFVGALRKMAIGSVAKPIRTASGVHIIKLADIKGETRQISQQAKVRHILIRPDAVTTPQQAEQKIQQIRARILKGEDFAALAKEFSQDGSAASGGDLGWSSQGQFVPEFQKAVDSLSLNTLSEPIHSQFGWHLVEVLARRNYDETQDVLRNQVRQELREQKAREQQELWLGKLRDEAYVEYHLPQTPPSAPQ